MNIILLSGGSGKRLWPLSNEVRSKQFLKIFRRPDGSKESMVQRMYRMIKEVDSNSNITIATSENQIPQITSQLGEDVNISVEPTRKDTFPAIALAVAYIHKKSDLGIDEPVIICPVDPYVERDYFECLKLLSDTVKESDGSSDTSNTGNASSASGAGGDGGDGLVLIGIEPTYPSEKYGYIIPASSAPISPVLSFKEKPDTATAEQYIKSGALWNAGVFAFKIGYLLEKSRSLLGTDDYDELLNRYADLEKISFDYAVAEKEKNIKVLRFKGSWQDLGTWNTLTEAMDEPVSGNAVAEDCIKTHVINELNLPLIAIGLKDAVVAATPDGILVSDKNASTQLKNILEKQKQKQKQGSTMDNITNDITDGIMNTIMDRPMYERRNWGEYKVLDYKRHSNGENSLVKELIISAGEHISYQKHRHRTEIWTFTEGIGELIINGVTKTVSRGDVAIIKPGMEHAIKGITELHIIEVQIGDELTEDDIERLDWNWQ